MSFLYSLANKIGYAVCHQMPSRTIVMGGVYLPLAGRTSGIYIGFLISAIILFALFRKRENGLAPLHIMIIFYLFIFSTMFDWLGSYLGLYESSNNIRFITGFLTGSSIMAIIFPVINFQYYKKSSNDRIFKNPVKFIIYFFIIVLFITINLFRFSFLSMFYYYFSAFSVFFTFFFVNLLMLLLVPVFANKAPRFISRFLILPSIISIVLTFIELFVSAKIRELFQGLGI
jgi:uncharacterized membrane protein